MVVCVCGGGLNHVFMCFGGARDVCGMWYGWTIPITNAERYRPIVMTLKTDLELQGPALPDAVVGDGAGEHDREDGADQDHHLLLFFGECWFGGGGRGVFVNGWVGGWIDRLLFGFD